MKNRNKASLVLVPIGRGGQTQLRRFINIGSTHEFTAFRSNLPGHPLVYTLAPRSLMNDVETLLGTSECLMPCYRSDR